MDENNIVCRIKSNCFKKKSNCLYLWGTDILRYSSTKIILKIWRGNIVWGKTDIQCVRELHPQGGTPTLWWWDSCDITHAGRKKRRRSGPQFPLKAEWWPGEPPYERGGCRHPCTPTPGSDWGSPLRTFRFPPVDLALCMFVLLRQWEAGPQLWPQHRPPPVGWESRLALWCCEKNSLIL